MQYKFKYRFGWTDEQTAELLKLRNTKSLSFSNIAKLLRRTHSDVYGRYNNLYPDNKKKHFWTEEEIKKLISFIKRGLTNLEISDKLNISASAVQNKRIILSDQSMKNYGKPWSEEEDKILSGVYDPKEFREKFERGVKEVSQRRRFLNGKCSINSNKGRVRNSFKQLQNLDDSIIEQDKDYSKIKYNLYGENLWKKEEVNLLIDSINNNIPITRIAVILQKPFGVVYSKLQSIEDKTKKNYGKPWSIEEDEALLSGMSLQIFSNKFERGKKESSKRKITLKQKKIELGFNDRTKGVRWTTQEVKLLKNLADKGETVEVIATKIKRSISAIRAKLHLIDYFSYHKDIQKEWTKEEDQELLKENYELKNLGLKFKRSQTELRIRRRELLFNLKGSKYIPRLVKQIESLKPINGKIYDDVPRKHYVQDILYKALHGMNCSILTMLGPTPERIIMLMKKYILGAIDIIQSYEIDHSEFKKQLDELERIDFKRIELHRSDILKASPEKFIDLDLMGRWETQSNLIKQIFFKQQEKYIIEEKAFLFSISVMGKSLEDMNEHIKNILFEITNKYFEISNIKILLKKNDEEIFVRKFQISADSKFKVNAYMYSDTSTMLSVSIQYI